MPNFHDRMSLVFLFANMYTLIFDTIVGVVVMTAGLGSAVIFAIVVVNVWCIFRNRFQRHVRGRVKVSFAYMSYCI